MIMCYTDDGLSEDVFWFNDDRDELMLAGLGVFFFFSFPMVPHLAFLPPGV